MTEEVSGVFPPLVLSLIDWLPWSRLRLWMRRLYLQYQRDANYAIVCGFGFLVNTAILYTLAPVLPLFLANLVAVVVAWRWNFEMSLGRFGHLWGFTVTEKELK